MHQISRVENCQLSLVGELSFRMRKGACTNLANEMVYICFPEVFRASSGKRCYRASQPLGAFESVVDSTYSHKSTRIGNDGGRVDLTVPRAKSDMVREGNVGCEVLLFGRYMYYSEVQKLSESSF